jgi:hypothetical protein
MPFLGIWRIAGLGVFFRGFKGLNQTWLKWIDLGHIDISLIGMAFFQGVFILTLKDRSPQAI